MIGPQRGAACLATAVLLVATGCRPGARSPAPPETPAESRVETTAAAPDTKREETTSLPEGEPVVAITHAGLLRSLEEQGLDLCSRFEALLGPALMRPDQMPEARPVSCTNAALPSRAWGALAGRVVGELARVRRADPAAGVDVARFSHRLFDERWLGAPNARFDLVGVSQRLDRIPFEAGSCGEVRLLYRLSYVEETAGESVTSRLPMTLALEYRMRPDDTDASSRSPCQELARSWHTTLHPSDPALAAPLLSGPLAPRALGPAHVLRVVLNVQTVRWPSTVRGDLGGHAEYLLAAFHWDDERGRLLPEPLENTPDVPALTADPKRKGELKRWLLEHVDAIDAGAVQIPARFLATSALSVSPRGMTRRANRPFRTLFSPADFAGETFGGTYVRSPEGLLRRLDDLSCVGCHQSRSVAGFHWLGEDGPEVSAGNALVSPVSPHVEDELQRRRALTRALARGERADFVRPPAEANREAGYGSRCGLGDASFSDWTCAPGLTCVPYDVAPGERTVLGTCLPEQPEAGDPCELGHGVPHVDPHKDRIAFQGLGPCAEGAVCNRSVVGFPGGMCTSHCADASDHVRCGPLAVLAPFNACLARGEPFPRCLERHVRPVGLRACSRSSPCREDYICARAQADNPEAGVCLPPYFLFQLRVDGHSPARAKSLERADSSAPAARH